MGSGPAALTRAFVERWNAPDADGLADLFEPDGDFVNIAGLWWHRREDIRTGHRYAFERRTTPLKLELLRIVVRELENMAVVRALWSLTAVGRSFFDGAPTDRSSPAGASAGYSPNKRGVLLLVAQRSRPSDGVPGVAGWVITAAQNTVRVPGAAALAAGELPTHQSIGRV